MMYPALWRCAALIIAVWPIGLAGAAAAQSAGNEKSAAPLDVCAVAQAEKRQGICIPSLTPVRLELAEPLSSRTSVTGQVFTFSLADPIIIDGHKAVAAGAKGRGEVIHAKKTGVGVGGELVLAARVLNLGDRHLRLRSLQLTAAGRDQQALTFAVGVTVGLPALFIRGKHIDVPAGAIAVAKTAEMFWLDAPDVPANNGSEPNIMTTDKKGNTQ